MTTSSLATEAGMRRVALGWTLLCILLGIALGFGVFQLRDASDAVDDASLALVRTGKVISAFDGLPLVGGGVEKAGDSIAEQGRRASGVADTTRTRVTVIAFAVGLLVTVMGSVPMLVTWRVVAALERERSTGSAPRPGS